MLGGVVPGREATDKGGTVNVAHGADEAPIPDDAIARLTEVAARAAARHADPKPTSAAAVATTRNKALEVLAAYGPQTIPGESGTVPVYAVVMTGRFTSPRSRPLRPDRPVPRPITGSCLLIVVEAATLEVRDVGVRNWHPEAALAQLGPVTRLTW
jgi:hypothetical protein